MKNKLTLIFVAGLILFAPFVARAYILYPEYITIVVNTEGGDALFHFTFDEYSGGILHNSTPFDLQTENLSASTTMSPVPNTYNITQDIALGLKISSIFCVSDNPDDTFLYQDNSVKFTPKLSQENITCTFNNVVDAGKTPVLIVPGLVGTEIFKNSEKLWPDVTRMLLDVGDDFMDPIRFKTNLTPSDEDVSPMSVIRRELIFDYTESLINEFVGQGYTENQDLFTFPYDWRYGVSGKYADGKTNSDLLEDKINEVLQQTGADKVDVVAHSMGGLIVKKYVVDHFGDNHIDKAVFVGVPNTGAPKAIKGLIQGDNFGVLGLSDAEIKKISANMPSAYDLLPSQAYYNVKGDSFIEVITKTSPFTTEIKNLNYEESQSFLVDDHGLNSLAVSNATSLHTESFDNFDMRTAGVDVYAIDGCRAGTLGKVIEVRSKDLFGNGHVSYEKPKEVPGDGTVPFESATNLPINQENKYYALNADHGKMLSQNGTRQEIVNLISGSRLDTGNSLISKDKNQCQLNGKAISVFSPVDIFVTDQDGNRLGLSEDGSAINEIPNADFQVWDTHKFLYLPTDNGQVYNIGIEGTDSGTYTIKADNIQNSQIAQTEVFSNLPVTADLAGRIIFGDTTTLSLDMNGDGATDQTVEPSAVLAGDRADDLISPVSEAIIVREQKKPGKKIISWLKGKKQDSEEPGIEINITATDEGSGVLNISYNLDGAGFQKIDGDTAKVDIFGEGKHTIVFFATDKAGNNEIEQTLDFEMKGNKNRLKTFITEIKNLMYNKIKVNIDKEKIKFPLKSFLLRKGF